MGFLPTEFGGGVGGVSFPFPFRVRMWVLGGNPLGFGAPFCRPPPSLQAAALDVGSKEQKDAALDRRIAALRKKNEALVRRYQVCPNPALIPP